MVQYLGYYFPHLTQGAIQLPDFAEILSPGPHAVELKMEKGSSMPFALAVGYYSLRPPSSDQCKVGIAVSLKDAAVDEHPV